MKEQKSFFGLVLDYLISEECMFQFFAELLFYDYLKKKT